MQAIRVESLHVLVWVLLSVSNEAVFLFRPVSNYHQYGGLYVVSSLSR